MLDNLGSSNKNILELMKKQNESYFQMTKELGSMGASLANIEKMLAKTALTYTQENIVLQTYDQPFNANGYNYNSLIVGDNAAADNAKLVCTLGGVSFTTPLLAGDNAINIPDGAMIHVTTTSGKPVTAILERYNTPGNNDTNVALQTALPTGSNVIGNVGINGAIPAGGNVIGNVGINGAIPTGSNTIGNVGLNAGSNVVGTVKIQDNGGNAIAVQNATGDAIAPPSYPLASTDFQYLYNGSTWDRMRSNQTLVNALASAARTASAASAALTNQNGRGIRLVLTVTAASGTGGLTVQVLDQAGKVNVQATTAVTATGTYIYYIYPGVSTGGTQALSAVIARAFSINVVAGDATSYTYQVDYELIN